MSQEYDRNMTALRDALAATIREWGSVNEQRSKDMDIFDSTWKNLWTALDNIGFFSVDGRGYPFFGKITVEEMYGMMKPVVQHAHRKAIVHCLSLIHI